MKKIMILLLMIIVVGSINCVNVPSDPEDIEKAVIAMPVKYGDNVYYFNATRANFGKSLQFFISSHTKVRIVTITSDGTGVYGATDGYFVVVEVVSPR